LGQEQVILSFAPWFLWVFVAEPENCHFYFFPFTMSLPKGATTARVGFLTEEKFSKSNRGKEKKMKREKIIPICVAIILVPILIMTGGTPAAAQPATSGQKIIVKCASPYAPTLPVTIFGNQWFDYITQKTNGRITFTRAWGSTLCKATECIDVVEKGAVDMVSVTPLYLPDQFPLALYTYAVPFGTPDSRTMLKIGYDMFKEVPELKAEWDRRNVEIMYMYTSDEYALLTKKPVTKLSDLKGMKLFSGGTYYPKMLESVGAAPVFKPLSEMYTPLQTGGIDGTFMAINLIESVKLWEVAKHVTFVGIGAAFLGYWQMNKDFYKKMDPQDQEFMKQTGFEFAMKQAEKDMADVQVNIDKWKKQGVKFYTLPKEDVKKWASINSREALAKSRDDKGVPGTKLVDSYVRISKKYGHEFP
jgi:TRAP-type C4-dicarboxylate transport system substrate-binding protein